MCNVSYTIVVDWVVYVGFSVIRKKCEYKVQNKRKWTKDRRRYSMD
jgi:hypothetical protein